MKNKRYKGPVRRLKVEVFKTFEHRGISGIDLNLQYIWRKMRKLIFVRKTFNF